MLLSELKAHEGRTLTLTFLDGYSAVVRLLHVDEDDRHELIYDVVEVLQWGPLDPERIDLSAAHCARLDELAFAVA